MFTYEPAQIGAGGKDRVRFEIGDTDPDDALLEDEEIDGMLAVSEGGYLEAAARCARAIASVFYRELSLQAGTVKLEYRQRAESYERVAERLELAAGLTPGSTAAGAAAGGISAGGIAGAEGNYFGTGMMDGASRGAYRP